MYYECSPCDFLLSRQAINLKAAVAALYLLVEDHERWSDDMRRKRTNERRTDRPSSLEVQPGGDK